MLPLLPHRPCEPADEATKILNPKHSYARNPEHPRTLKLQKAINPKPYKTCLGVTSLEALRGGLGFAEHDHHDDRVQWFCLDHCCRSIVLGITGLALEERRALGGSATGFRGFLARSVGAFG